MVKQDGPKRRWYQFRLRTRLILAVVLLVAVPCCAVAANRVWTQRSAVAEIEKLGGRVFYDVNISELPEAFVPLKNWFGIDAVANVKGANLWGPSFTDKELECLKAFVHLQSLSLVGAAITDSGLRHLKGFKKLREVDLWDTNIGDEGVRQLQGLASLQKLNLRNTKVTDVGLKHLAGLTTLSELWLAKTQVTDAGVADLQKSLPKCKINR